MTFIINNSLYTPHFFFLQEYTHSKCLKNGELFDLIIFNEPPVFHIYFYFFLHTIIVIVLWTNVFYFYIMYLYVINNLHIIIKNLIIYKSLGGFFYE